MSMKFLRWVINTAEGAKRNAMDAALAGRSCDRERSEHGVSSGSALSELIRTAACSRTLQQGGWSGFQSGRHALEHQPGQPELDFNQSINQSSQLSSLIDPYKYSK